MRMCTKSEDNEPNSATMDGYQSSTFSGPSHPDNRGPTVFKSQTPLYPWSNPDRTQERQARSLNQPATLFKTSIKTIFMTKACLLFYESNGLKRLIKSVKNSCGSTQQQQQLTHTHKKKNIQLSYVHLYNIYSPVLNSDRELESSN